jgi:hypothetical protein
MIEKVVKMLLKSSLHGSLKSFFSLSLSQIMAFLVKSQQPLVQLVSKLMQLLLQGLEYIAFRNMLGTIFFFL